MKKVFILLGVALALVLGSCAKKASEMIVGHWKVDGWYDDDYWVFQTEAIWEFDSDGTMRFEYDGQVNTGNYNVDGPNIMMSYDRNGDGSLDGSMSGQITYISHDHMDCVLDDGYISGGITFCRTDESAQPGGGGNGGDNTYSVIAVPNVEEGGWIDGAGMYVEGDRCALTAYANPGYVFINWTENGEVVSTDLSYSFMVTRNRDLVANFEWEYSPTQILQFEWNGYVFNDGEYLTCTNDELGFGELIQHMQIRNKTDETRSVVIEKNVVQDLDGVSNYFCWGMCYGSDVISSLPVSVPAQSLNVEDLSFHAFFMDQIYGSVVVKYYAYEENNPDERISITVRYIRFSGDIIEGSTISVTGDTWFVLDHHYTDGETIHLEKATFGLYGAADDAGHQQLISGGEGGYGDLLRIGQAGLIWTDYSYVYFNMGLSESVIYYGNATSVADGYIFNNADIVFSPSSLWIDGNLVTSYETRHFALNTNMCLFANGEDGWDSVQGQTATLGTVTITDAYGYVTAQYIPTLDDNGTPCFYNLVSGAYIYHSGSGTPMYHVSN